ncbi:cupin domain-containing protein [Paenibacillus sp. JX-17]|uniref:Cupin domain-containing protein n=1 Tax=Paenibacillus lacisoli TaxID=3064525 RepID=A0ABT9CI04_9BACL|nr:cupin domain-containing protein [Paenibacillus sp. JX-17]MDO7908912.1 cupin domain-containing protein [Paenibacillus sp. JX-17]
MNEKQRGSDTKDFPAFPAAMLPRLVYIGKVDGNPNWNFPSHTHDNVSEMVYVSEGEGIIKIDGLPYAVKQGDLLVYNQGVIHEQCTSPICPLSLYYCGISNIQLEGVRPGNLIPEGVSPYIQTKEYTGKFRMCLKTKYYGKI